MSTLTITDFLEARISEDEAVAGEPVFRGEPVDSRLREVLAGHAGGLEINASRVRAECESKRTILELHAACVREGYDNAAAYLEDALRALAAVYKDHPDYRKEWAL